MAQFQGEICRRGAYRNLAVHIGSGGKIQRGWCPPPQKLDLQRTLGYWRRVHIPQVQLIIPLKKHV